MILNYVQNAMKFLKIHLQSTVFFCGAPLENKQINPLNMCTNESCERNTSQYELPEKALFCDECGSPTSNQKKPRANY